jgi:flagellar motor switch protein FliN/FliY
MEITKEPQTAATATADAADVSTPEAPMPEPFPEAPVAVAKEKENPEESIQRVKYPPLTETAVSPTLSNIDYLKDVNLEASVELGSANLTVEKVLNLGVGAVVELLQNVGDPVKLVINHNLYALGEVVVIGDKFGVRITKLVRSA